VAHRVAPDAKNSALLQKSYQTYRRIYPALHEVFPSAI
jgi:sugar (pentulose or hexulose) kinase